MKQVFTFCLIFFVSSFFAKAQILKKFSDNPNEYYKQLTEKLTVNMSDETEVLLNNFGTAWLGDSLFSNAEREKIISLSNILLKRKARPEPHFTGFLNSLLLVKKHVHDSNNYTTWFKATEKIFSDKKYSLTKIKTYLGFTELFLTRYVLSETSSVTWKTAPTVYRFIQAAPLAVKIEATSLVCLAKRDSIEVFETSGIYHPIENIFEANTALVTWERGGYNRDLIWADLHNFQIDLTRSEFRADSVKFTNKNFFNEPLYGNLHQKVVFIKKPASASYPKFYSYKQNFIIENFYPDLTYRGGMSMEGAKLVGRGTQDNPAHIYIYRNDTMLINASSNYFAFRTERIISRNTSIAILLEQDSIFHPDLSFNYTPASRELTLLRNDNFTSQGPYFNSYHKIDMNFDQLYWNLNEPVMYFTAQRGASIGNANFESVNLFDQKRFDILYGMDFSHPLITIRSFAKNIGREEFTALEYANYTKKSMTQARHQLMDLSRNGFIFFDVNTDKVTIKQRLHDYIKANAGFIDYDVINLESTTRSPLENASFDTRTFDLIINGMPQVTVSNAQSVQIFPENNRIVMKRNRNFQFNGKVQAGLLTFYGDNFFFNYDTFKISMQSVDSLNINYLMDEKDEFGRPMVGEIKNNLRYLTGALMIDKSDNKSGVQDYPEYPLFKSNENSYVFYNSKSIQNGVYNSEEFYFELDTFVMDSLDNFTKEGLQYKGTLYSAGIFPPIRQQLVLQKDESLGFHHQTENQGIPTYGGKGQYYATIHLSNKGLRGLGFLEYITSTTRSHDFIFFPDSMNTQSYAFNIQEKTTAAEFPKVKATDNNIHWMPYNDEMYIEQTAARFNMFNDTTYLKGNLKLTPQQLTGQGRMDLKNSDLQSGLFTYKAKDIFADTSEFYLKSLHSDGFTIITENINSHINYRQRKGYFRSNEAFSLVEFPENRYVSYLDYFTWIMDDKKLVMAPEKPVDQSDVYLTEDGTEPVGARYISLHPDQDSINFVSPLANYDYRNNIINADQVKFVRSADARLYPDKHKLSIAEDAHMLAMKNAVIITNEAKEYHRIYNATIQVNGRLAYTASGTYNYIDQNKEIQQIYFSDISIDDSLNTIATGHIIEPDNFTLSPVYQYQGKVHLYAPEQFLQFDGSVLAKHNCNMLSPDWLNFDARIDPLNIYIPLQDKLKNINSQDIHAGFFIHYDSVHVYPTFLSKTKFHSDKGLNKTEGYLYYYQKRDEFILSEKAKIGDFNIPGNYLSFHRNNCTLFSEGEINLGQYLGLLEMESYGQITSDLNDHKKDLDLTVYLDFFLSDELKNIFASEVDSAPALKPIDINRELYVKTLKSRLSDEEGSKYFSEVNLFGEANEIPEPIKKTLVLTELSLQWDDQTNSYRSVGDIGIASIFNTQVNKKVKGYFELQIKRSGDLLDIYLEIDKNTYYYFGYTRGVLHTLSSNTIYNNYIKELKAKHRKYKVKGNRTPYIFILAADRKRAITIKRWNQWLEKLNESDIIKDEIPDELQEELPSESVILQDESTETENATPDKVEENIPEEYENGNFDEDF